MKNKLLTVILNSGYKLNGPWYGVESYSVEWKTLYPGEKMHYQQWNYSDTIPLKKTKQTQNDPLQKTDESHNNSVK